jgi:hypothetical protein
MLTEQWPLRWHIVRIPASKVWTLIEAQTIPPLAVAKIGWYSSSNAIPGATPVQAWHGSTCIQPVALYSTLIA